MIRGLYTSLSAIMAAMTRQSVVADNLANLNTPGFHQSRTANADFGLELGSAIAGPIGHLGTATLPVGLSLDRSQGPLEQTGAASDLAIEGAGLFVVRTPEGIAYTRAGAFTLSSTGGLTTQEGYPVLDTTGAPVVSRGALVVGPDGSLAGGGQRLAVVDWPAGEPVRLGHGLLAVAGPARPGSGLVRQGVLERSNVDVATTMTELMTIQRHFSLSSRALSLQEETLGDAAQVGRVR